MTSELTRLFFGLFLTILMLAGLAFTWTALRGRQRLRELAYQERIAMIERGLVPSPETDPARFEALLAAPRRTSVKAIRYRTAGIIVTGMGLALTVLLFFVVPEIRGIALGVGGAITILGLSVLMNGVLLGTDDVEGSARNSTGRG